MSEYSYVPNAPLQSVKNPEQIVTGDIPAGSGKPLQTPVIPFCASLKERIAAFLMYICAFIYVTALFAPPTELKFLMGIFTVGFIALTEYLYLDVRRSIESYIWLFCLIFIYICIALNRVRVWDTAFGYIFMHIFAVYWVAARAGKLIGQESGHLLAADVFNGFLRIPVMHFFLRIRCVVYSFKRRKKTEFKVASLLVSVTVILFAIVLFIVSASLLSSADEAFGKMLGNVFRLPLFRPDAMLNLKIVLSLPVGAFLFGLIAGVGRTRREKLDNERSFILATINKLHQVPSAVWFVLLSAFVLFYLVFFAFQGRYLFGAFVRMLPEGFTVAEYARQGFFELCRIMAINFFLFWLVTRTHKCSGTPGKKKFMTFLCTALLGESIIFAVIAFSKLVLYISCFGFTAKRLQSAWLICLLFVGCICILCNYLTGKKSFRFWMVYGALSLSLLCVY